jgi:hypothetical protein
VSEGIQKVVGLTIFAALIVLGIVASDTDGQTTTRNAAIPMLNMDGEEEPPPPSDKALAKLEDKVNEMGEMILEIASQVENLTPAGAEGNQEGLEQLSSQVSDLVGELRRTNTRLVLARAEALLRDRGCEVQRGNEDEPWSCWYEGVNDWGNPFGGQFAYEDLPIFPVRTLAASTLPKQTLGVPTLLAPLCTAVMEARRRVPTLPKQTLRVLILLVQQI